MIAAGTARLPLRLTPARTCAQVIGIELIDAAAAKAEFGRDLPSGERALAEGRQQVTDQGRGQTMSQLPLAFSSRHPNNNGLGALPPTPRSLSHRTGD